MEKDKETLEPQHDAKKTVTPLSMVLIQAAVIIYTGSVICSKMASGHKGQITFLGREIHWLSAAGYMWLFLEVMCLGFYAVFWQQIIKRFDLSVAYANRAFAIFWTFLWSIILFHETVTIPKVIGIVIVFFGILLVNSDTK